MARIRILAGLLILLPAVRAAAADPADATDPPRRAATYEFTVTERLPVTASSTMTIPAKAFEVRPLESGGQMLEAVPGVITAQHTGGGKAEQYFLRGFDADHGTDLAVYFDGVPMNLRSHAHGQGFLDLHFVTKETIERLDAYKGPYFAEFGDFATAAAVRYVPFERQDESFLKVEGGEFDTLRTVGIVSPRTGAFAEDGPAKAMLSFESYHSDGPFDDNENLWRYSLFGRGSYELAPELELSGHLLAYYSDWDASGLIPAREVDANRLSRWGSEDPTEGGESRRLQGKLQADWSPTPQSHLMALAYVSYYDLELYSNFTYFLNDTTNGDGIVQRDDGRVYTGGRVEYVHVLDAPMPARLTAGTEARYDDADVRLGTQTRRNQTSTTSADEVHELSLEPYVQAELLPLDWVRFIAGLRFAWFQFDGRDRITEAEPGPSYDSRWLPKASLVLSPFSGSAPLASDVAALRDLELFLNFGIGYHSNDARAGFGDEDGEALPKATGFEVGLRTRFFERMELAFSAWSLVLDDELVFVGDEGTTESAGESHRRGLELAGTWSLLDWLYLRGDVAWTSARLDAPDVPIPQAPRFIAKGSLGVDWKGLLAELSVRSLGERYPSEDMFSPKLDDYTVLDFGMRYRWRMFELGLAVENITSTNWRSSEFFYASCVASEVGVDPACPVGGGGEGVSDLHFTPGNPRNVRGWIRWAF